MTKKTSYYGSFCISSFYIVHRIKDGAIGFLICKIDSLVRTAK